MAMENNFREFINAVGALSEIAGLLRDQLVKNGFTRVEACQMVSTILASMIKPDRK